VRRADMTPNNLAADDVAAVERMTRRIYAANFIECGTINAPTLAAAVAFLQEHAADGGSIGSRYHVEWRRRGVTVDVPGEGRSGFLTWTLVASMIRRRSLVEWVCWNCGTCHDSSEQPDRCDSCTWNAVFVRPTPTAPELPTAAPPSVATTGHQLALFASGVL
jgi:rubrerythrin